VRLLELQVGQYKILKDFSIDFTDNLSIVIGKNGAGKTTFYEVITQIFSALHRWVAVSNFNFQLKYEIKTPRKTILKSQLSQDLETYISSYLI